MLPLLAAALLVAPRPPAPAAPASPDLPAVSVGDVGHGLTVLEGAKIERFDVVYLGRLERALPGQDLHLIRIADPRFETSGVIAGMSGSPIYFDGRLLGALGYAWTFSKEPIAGVTPIDAMRRLGDRAARTGRGAAPAGLAPVATPLWTSGIPAEALAPHLDRLRSWGIEAVPAGASADGPPDLDLVPGAAVGVTWIRGDLQMTVIGTVTERRGDRVLAFGHPMLGLGEVEMPMTTAVVHTVIPSVSRSVKLGSPVRAVGALVGDGQPAVAGVVGKGAPMIPVSVRLDGPGGRETMRMEVADHDLLTPFLLEVAWSGAVESSLWRLGEATFEVSVEARVEPEAGGTARRVAYRDVGYGRLSPLQAAPLEPLLALAENPEERVRIAGVDVAVRARLERRTAEVAEAGVVEGAVRPGETVTVWARLDPFGGGSTVERLVLRVPRGTPPGRYPVWVGAGRGRFLPGRPRPRDLDGWIRLVEEIEPRDSLVAEIALPGAGAEAEGVVLPALPPTYAAVQAADRSPSAGPLRLKVARPTPWILAGGRAAEVVVEAPRP